MNKSLAFVIVLLLNAVVAGCASTRVLAVEVNPASESALRSLKAMEGVASIVRIKIDGRTDIANVNISPSGELISFTAGPGWMANVEIYSPEGKRVSQFEKRGSEYLQR